MIEPQISHPGHGNAVKSFFSRLANQLILTFTLTISVCIIALILVSYNRTSTILINDLIHSNQSILKLLSINYQNYIAQIDELTVTFRKDTTFMDIITGDSWKPSDEIYVQNQIKIMFYSRNDIEAIRFYLPNTGKLYSITRANAKLKITYNPALVDEAWYQKTKKGKYFRYIEPVTSRTVAPETKNTFFIFSRALVSIPGWRPLGVVSISFNRSVLDDMIMDTSNQPGEVLCIYDSLNRPFFISDPLLARDPAILGLISSHGKARNDYFRAKIQGRKYLITSGHTDEWGFVKLIPVNLIQSKVRQTRNISFLIGGVFILLFIALTIFVSNTITSPLRRLSRQMDKVGAGNFTAKTEIKGSLEIVRLAERFNFMVDQINELINEKYLAQLNEKSARIKALEAQINPHFLYNSLQAIATKAVMSGMKDISRMVEAFAFILRYCIKGGDRVRISEEIEHIQKYLLLQAVRYEDRLSVAIQVEEGLGPTLIPKLSIQTLVENSVHHALEHMTRAITIGIHAYAERDRIIIRVTDDGPGMTPEHLRQVIAEMEETPWSELPDASIGLKNLNSRLKLMYGDAAQLVIKSVWGQGTEASIILPIQSGGGNGVQSIAD